MFLFAVCVFKIDQWQRVVSIIEMILNKVFDNVFPGEYATQAVIFIQNGQAGNIFL